eukprot:361535-Chlamydomonas_euryale.AAC.3
MPKPYNLTVCPKLCPQIPHTLTSSSDGYAYTYTLGALWRHFSATARNFRPGCTANAPMPPPSRLGT